MARVERVERVCDGCGKSSDVDDVETRGAADGLAVELEACPACWSPLAALLEAGRRSTSPRRRRSR